MEKEKKSIIGVMDVLLLVLTLAFLIGIKTLFHPCGPKDDGSWMTCHWAGQSIFGIAIALFVMAIFHFLSGIIFKKPIVKAGIALSMIPISLIAIFTPGNLIGLCMMEDMRCHSVMRPAVIVFGITIAAASIIDIFIQRSSQNYEDKWGDK